MRHMEHNLDSVVPYIQSGGPMTKNEQMTQEFPGSFVRRHNHYPANSMLDPILLAP